MPKNPIDYSKTIIYRIVCKNPEIKDCYVGSTTDFKSRKKSHKKCCNYETNKDYNIKVYQFIREHNGWENWEMLEIEKYNAKDQPDQAKRERYWLEFYSATLNSNIPSRTKLESDTKYREENKEKMAEYQKEYYKINRDYKKEPITCVCGSICRNSDIRRHENTKKHIKYIAQNK